MNMNYNKIEWNIIEWNKNIEKSGGGGNLFVCGSFYSLFSFLFHFFSIACTHLFK